MHEKTHNHGNDSENEGGYQKILDQKCENDVRNCVKWHHKNSVEK